MAATSSSLLTNKSFVRLFAAQAVSLAGSGVTTVALALLVRDLAGPLAATAILGQVLMLRILAFLVFSQPAGILADRVSRKVLLVSSDLARVVILAAFPFIHEIWQVYVAVFLVNTLTAVFTPAYEATLPEVAGADYTTALAYSRVAIDMEAILGPALAGVLLGFMGLHWVFLIDAASYLLSAVLVLSVRIPVASHVREAREGPWKQLTYGTRLLFGEPSVRQALILSVAEAVAGACAIVITVVYVRDVLKYSSSAFAWTMTAVGIGSSLGALLLNLLSSRLERGRSGDLLHATRHRWAKRALLAGGAATVASLIGGVLQPSLAPFAILWLLNGASQAWIAIPSATLVAEHTAAGERGRAFGAHFAWTHLSWLFAYPLVGLLASHLGAAAALSVCGVICFLVVAIAWSTGARSVSQHAY